MRLNDPVKLHVSKNDLSRIVTYGLNNFMAVEYQDDHKYIVTNISVNQYGGTITYQRASYGKTRK